MFHRSERLLLRPPWPEDWQALHAAIGEEAIVRNLANAPWPYSENDARWFAAREQDRRVPNFFLVLPGAEGAKLVGGAGLARTEDGIEIGYWIARDFWGQGFATEAAGAVIEIARLCGHRKLVSGHFLDNPASGRVLAKIGFAPTGEVASRYSTGRGEAVPTRLFAMDLSTTARAA